MHGIYIQTKINQRKPGSTLHHTTAAADYVIVSCFRLHVYMFGRIYEALEGTVRMYYVVFMPFHPPLSRDSIPYTISPSDTLASVFSGGGVGLVFILI